MLWVTNSELNSPFMSGGMLLILHHILMCVCVIFMTFGKLKSFRFMTRKGNKCCCFTMFNVY